MNESSAREVLLLQAFESSAPPSPSWSAGDRAWATRLALQDPAASATPDAFLATRARHAMQRLLSREPALRKALRRRLWRRRWVAWAVLAGSVAGLCADAIGTSQRINLLAPPVWTVVAWNLVVYLLLAGAALRRGVGRPRSGEGLLARWIERARRQDHDRAAPATGAAAARVFAERWLAASAPLAALRAAVLLHAAAAALGVGLIAGMYVRGLVLDYRASWESTFLTAHAVHAALSTLLAPAATLSGIALPDVAGIAALRLPRHSEVPGAPAAPWIHLYAWTLLIAVVLPRTALAGAGAARARWRATHVVLPLADPYFRRLLMQQRREAAQVRVYPYASAPEAAALRGLEALLAEALGDAITIEFAPTTAFGAEDDLAALPAMPPATTLVVALFDLSATPETENHGRFAARLAALAPPGAATIVLVDESAFRKRFGAEAARLPQRRGAWARLAEALGCTAVCAPLDEPAGALVALEAAIAAPLAAGGPSRKPSRKP